MSFPFPLVLPWRATSSLLLSLEATQSQLSRRFVALVSFCSICFLVWFRACGVRVLMRGLPGTFANSLGTCDANVEYHTQQQQSALWEKRLHSYDLRWRYRFAFLVSCRVVTDSRMSPCGWLSASSNIQSWSLRFSHVWTFLEWRHDRPNQSWTKRLRFCGSRQVAGTWLWVSMAILIWFSH